LYGIIVVLHLKIERKMKLILYYIAVMFISQVTVSAQVQDNVINPDNFNKALMEHFIKMRIDSVRHGKKLGMLQNDTFLFKAALDQATYLTQKKEIGHTQNNRKKKDPMERSHYYQADYAMVGENVARIYYLTNMQMQKGSKKPIYLRTYSEAAREMVEGWVHSPPHYKNMLTPDYDLTGVAISVNPKDKSITGVQVFGMGPQGYTPARSDKYFPYD
jgi:uncharacterized protein YkwD